MTGGVGRVQGSLAEYAAVGDAFTSCPQAGQPLDSGEAAAPPLVVITASERLVDRAG